MCFNSDYAAAKEAVSPVTVEHAVEAVRRGNAIFVDPRPAKAIAETTGMIPGALNVTLDDIRAGKLPAAFEDRSAAVITACQAGPMGAIAAHELSKMGFSDVVYVEGGTQAWLDAGHPTVR